MNNIYNWQFNCLPGQANQGAILMTRNDILRPPFTQDDFIWVAMEDVIGTADIRLTYNEKTNLYTLEKAIGHRNNDDSWIKDWYVVGSWERLSQEVAEILRQLVYIEYRFDTSVPNVLKVVAVKKDLTEVVLCDISFVSLQEFNQAIATLDDKITAETTRATTSENMIAQDVYDEVVRATTRENELQALIEAATMNPGIAIEVTPQKEINVKTDGNSIKVNNSNQLYADVFDDTQTRNDKGWSSTKISQMIHQIGTYKGKVATIADLPTQGVNNGDTYKVEADGNYYMWNGTTWDDLEGDYIAGAGIDITNRVISASGIVFGTGNGLEVVDVEGTSTLKVKAGNGIQFAADKTMSVKVNTTQGLREDNNGVAVKTDSSNGMTINNNGIAVKVIAPIVIDSQGNISLDYNTRYLGYEDGQLIVYLNPDSCLSIDPISGGIKINIGSGLHIVNNALDTVLKTWTGTQAQYDAIADKDSNTLYMIHE